MNATLNMHFRLPYTIELEDDVFVAICQPLDVSSQGDTQEEAGRMLVEALQLFLETCIEEGTVEAVLRDSGFRPAPDGTVEADGEGDYLDVPVTLLMTRGGQRRRSAA